MKNDFFSQFPVANRDNWSWQCRSMFFVPPTPALLCLRVTLATPSISSLRVTPHQVLKPFRCSLQLSQLGTPWRKNLSEQSTCSSRRQGPHRLCRRSQASNPSPGPEPTRMSNDSPSTRVISTLYSSSASIRRVSRGIKISVAAFASLTVADSLSTAHTTKFSVRRAQDTNSPSVGGGLPRHFVSNKVGLARAGFVAAATAAPPLCARDCGKSVKVWRRPCC